MEADLDPNVAAVLYLDGSGELLAVSFRNPDITIDAKNPSFDLTTGKNKELLANISVLSLTSLEILTFLDQNGNKFIAIKHPICYGITNRSYEQAAAE